MARYSKSQPGVPRQAGRRSRWMGSESAFLKVRPLVLVPSRRLATSSSGVVSVTPVEVEQLLKVCRKSGLKSKG